MDTVKLETFLAVARLQSFHKAADELYLTTSTVSKHIQSLETELNCTLFDRGMKNSTLTSEGKAILPYAEAMIDSYRLLISTISPIPKCSVLEIGSIAPYALVGIPDLLDAYSETNSLSHVLIVEEHGRDLPKMLYGKKYELIICADIHFNPSLMDCIVLQTRPYYVFVNINHHFADKACISLKELGGNSFIDLPEFTGVPEYKRSLLKSVGVDYKVNTTVEREENIVAMVSRNRGIALLDSSPNEMEAMEQYGRKKVMAIALSESIACEIMLVKAKNAVLSDAAASFWDFAKRTVEIELRKS